MADSDADRYTVPGLERGLRLLQEFSRGESSLSAPELARRLGVPRSTVFRLLVTLESMGFVERTNDGRAYRLGLAVLRLGFEYLASLDLVELGRPLLESLRDETNFAAGLVVRDGRDAVYLHRAPSRSPFASSVAVGTRLPAHATVLGLVLLSDLSLSALRTLYPEPRLEALSAHTPADSAALFEAAQRVRARGWVLSEGYFESNICTIAAPVRGRDGKVAAAIGLTVPGTSIPADRQAELVAKVCGVAAQLSALLDFRAEPADDGVVVPLRRA